jgi:predicted acetyltransferase
VEYRDLGWPIAALWPFDEAFYARYGWATASRTHTATLEPGALSVTTNRQRAPSSR